MKYEIIGEPMPVVVCDLEANEAMITERGSMVWMSPNMKMETGAGGIGKVYGDNVIEKHGINRDRTGDREKTRYLCGKQGVFTRDLSLIHI